MRKASRREGSGQPASATELERLWPLLSLDQKRYLVVCQLFETDIGAARHIGKGRGWLIWIKQKAAFKRALAIRHEYSDDQVSLLLDADLLLLLKSNVAGVVQTGRGLASREMLAAARLLSRAKGDHDRGSSDGPTVRAVTQDMVGIPWAHQGESRQTEPSLMEDTSLDPDDGEEGTGT